MGGLQDRHQQSAESQDRHAGRPGEGGEEGANQGGDNRGPAGNGADERLEKPDEPFGGAAFGEEVTDEDKKGEAGQSWIGDERIMFQRNRADGFLVPPKQDQRGAAQGDKNWGAGDGGGQEHDESWNEQAPGSHWRENENR